MSASESKKIDRKAEIVECAIKAFAKYGYHNTTMQNITEISTFSSPGTIFKYFPKVNGQIHGIKDDILRYIFVEKITFLTESVRKEVQEVEDPVSKIRAFVVHHFDQLKAAPALAKVLQVELRQSHHFLKDYDHKKIQEYLSVLDEGILLGQQLGVFKSTIPPTVLRWAMFGAMDEISTNWVLTDGKWPSDLSAVPDQLMETFIEGLRQNAGNR